MPTFRDYINSNFNITVEQLFLDARIIICFSKNDEDIKLANHILGIDYDNEDYNYQDIHDVEALEKAIYQNLLDLTDDNIDKIFRIIRPCLVTLEKGHNLSEDYRREWLITRYLHACDENDVETRALLKSLVIEQFLINGVLDNDSYEGIVAYTEKYYTATKRAQHIVYSIFDVNKMSNVDEIVRRFAFILFDSQEKSSGNIAKFISSLFDVKDPIKLLFMLDSICSGKNFKKQENIDSLQLTDKSYLIKKTKKNETSIDELINEIQEDINNIPSPKTLSTNTYVKQALNENVDEYICYVFGHLMEAMLIDEIDTVDSCKAIIIASAHDSPVTEYLKIDLDLYHELKQIDWLDDNNASLRCSLIQEILLNKTYKNVYQEENSEQNFTHYFQESYVGHNINDFILSLFKVEADTAKERREAILSDDLERQNIAEAKLSDIEIVERYILHNKVIDEDFKKIFESVFDQCSIIAKNEIDPLENQYIQSDSDIFTERDVHKSSIIAKNTAQKVKDVPFENIEKIEEHETRRSERYILSVDKKRKKEIVISEKDTEESSPVEDVHSKNSDSENLDSEGGKKDTPQSSIQHINYPDYEEDLDFKVDRVEPYQQIDLLEWQSPTEIMKELLLTDWEENPFDSLYNVHKNNENITFEQYIIKNNNKRVEKHYFWETIENLDESRILELPVRDPYININDEKLKDSEFVDPLQNGHKIVLFNPEKPASFLLYQPESQTQYRYNIEIKSQRATQQLLQQVRKNIGSSRHIIKSQPLKSGIYKASAHYSEKSLFGQKNTSIKQGIMVIEKPSAYDKTQSQILQKSQAKMHQLKQQLLDFKMNSDHVPKDPIIIEAEHIRNNAHFNNKVSYYKGFMAYPLTPGEMKAFQAMNIFGMAHFSYHTYKDLEVIYLNKKGVFTGISSHEASINIMKRGTVMTLVAGVYQVAPRLVFHMVSLGFIVNILILLMNSEQFLHQFGKDMKKGLIESLDEWKKNYHDRNQSKISHIHQNYVFDYHAYFKLIEAYDKNPHNLQLKNQVLEQTIEYYEQLKYQIRVQVALENNQYSEGNSGYSQKMHYYSQQQHYSMLEFPRYNSYKNAMADHQGLFIKQYDEWPDGNVIPMPVIYFNNQACRFQTIRTTDKQYSLVYPQADGTVIHSEVLADLTWKEENNIPLHLSKNQILMKTLNSEEKITYKTLPYQLYLNFRSNEVSVLAGKKTIGHLEIQHNKLLFVEGIAPNDQYVSVNSYLDYAKKEDLQHNKFVTLTIDSPLVAQDNLCKEYKNEALVGKVRNIVSLLQKYNILKVTYDLESALNNDNIRYFLNVVEQISMQYRKPEIQKLIMINVPADKQQALYHDLGIIAQENTIYHMRLQNYYSEQCKQQLIEMTKPPQKISAGLHNMITEYERFSLIQEKGIK